MESTLRDATGPTQVGTVWLTIGLVASAGYWALLLLAPDSGVTAGGGFIWQSLLYSTWESLICAGMVVGLIVLIRTVFRRANPVLAARCIDESGGHRPDDPTVHLLRTTLAELATGVVAPAKQRAAAGDALNHVGDLRPGVGVVHGLPDIDWVTIESGPFLMGSDKAVDEDARDNETSQFTCDLITRPYRIARYPVTVAQFNTFVEAGVCRPNLLIEMEALAVIPHP